MTIQDVDSIRNISFIAFYIQKRLFSIPDCLDQRATYFLIKFSISLYLFYLFYKYIYNIIYS
ncbi:hypothetical protein B0W47_01280 [Komagataeibacter nataicola]|uniref:Uncharacterized protein n=1 Tax=Komagataeibacter nataicola TaxID=265960 RepID=A0A9N7GZ81_9PROT|nr:hypothetical protein B0W47_01280 [Komagataeibacter nataicola]PYD66545.1 hypothetical protein CDI09_07440 [Komagataeibacter nataicola]